MAGAEGEEGFYLGPALTGSLEGSLHRVLPGQQHKLRSGCKEGIMQRLRQVLL